jgi:hypothetical protein
MNEAFIKPFQRAQRIAFGVSVAGTAACILGLFANEAQFFHSWLVAWLFFTGISCGSLVIVMMQALTGGQWGVAVQRLSEAAMLTLPLLAVFFVPVLIGIHDLFPWSRPDALAAHPKWEHKMGYLNLPFFALRGFLFFAVVGALAFRLRHWSVLQDKGGGLLPGKRIRVLSGGGLVVYVLAMNFISTDWVMSLAPDWYSTVFVVIFIAGQFLTALALMTLLLAVSAGRTPFVESIHAKHFHDLGNLLLTFVIFWIYVSFSQFLIIWSGNLPKEISWYLQRSASGWKLVALFLMIVQFLIPTGLLLFRGIKRKPERLALVSTVILGSNIVNVYWLVAPAFHPEGVHLHWLDFATLLTIGGFWTILFLRFLKQHPLLPLHPEEGLRHA